MEVAKSPDDLLPKPEVTLTEIGGKQEVTITEVVNNQNDITNNDNVTDTDANVPPKEEQHEDHDDKEDVVAKKEDIADDTTENPWQNVKSVMDFNFFCCPECEYK